MISKRWRVILHDGLVTLNQLLAQEVDKEVLRHRWTPPTRRDFASKVNHNAAQILEDLGRFDRPVTCSCDAHTAATAAHISGPNNKWDNTRRGWETSRRGTASIWPLWNRRMSQESGSTTCAKHQIERCPTLRHHSPGTWINFIRFPDGETIRIHGNLTK